MPLASAWLSISGPSGWLLATATIAGLHAILPSHWLPFVLVGQRERWTPGRTAAIAAIAAAGHAIATAVIGGVVALAGGLIERLLHTPIESLGASLEEHVHLIGGGFLVLFAFIYAFVDLRHLGHRHAHEAHGHDGDPCAMHEAASGTEPLAIGGLVLMLSLSPCVALMPLFLGSALVHGPMAVLAIALVNLLVTTCGMVIVTYLASRGLARLEMPWLKKAERPIVFGLLLLLGAITMFLDHHA